MRDAAAIVGSRQAARVLRNAPEMSWSRVHPAARTRRESASRLVAHVAAALSARLVRAASSGTGCLCGFSCASPLNRAHRRQWPQTRRRRRPRRRALSGAGVGRCSAAAGHAAGELCELILLCKAARSALLELGFLKKAKVKKCPI